MELPLQVTHLTIYHDLQGNYSVLFYRQIIIRPGNRDQQGTILAKFMVALEIGLLYDF